MAEIIYYIVDIPEKAGSYDIISHERKQEYVEELTLRIEYVLKPAYKNIIARESSIEPAHDATIAPENSRHGERQKHEDPDIGR